MFVSDQKKHNKAEGHDNAGGTVLKYTQPEHDPHYKNHMFSLSTCQMRQRCQRPKASNHDTPLTHLASVRNVQGQASNNKYATSD